MKTLIEKHIKFADKEVEVFLQFIKTVYGKTISIFPSEGEDFDSPWSKNFDGIIIIADDNMREFEVGHEVYEHGGYMEPSTTDYAEHSKHKDLSSALLTMFMLWFAIDYRNFQESQWAEECVLEMDEGYL